MVVSELLIHTPMGKNITTEVQCLCAVPFAFDFIDSTYSRSYLGQHLPLFPSMRFFQTFLKKVRGFCEFYPGISLTPQ